jgi:putative transcriptional regulator
MSGPPSPKHSLLPRRHLLLSAAGLWQAPPFQPGQMLAAAPSLRDPDFARSVILLFSASAESVMGLMLNRPLPRRAGEPQMYAGGPVAQGVRSLLPEAGDPSATRLCPGVWLVPGQTRSPKGRIYLGYTGWTAAQLRQEWLRGLWRILPGDAAAVFDPEPERLWQRLQWR